VDPGGVFGLAGFAPRQFALQPLGHERQAGKLLAEVVVQIQADAAAFIFGDFQQFVFEALPFGDGAFEAGVGGF